MERYLKIIEKPVKTQNLNFLFGRQVRNGGLIDEFF